MARKDLNSPRRELSNGGLERVVTLLAACQIDYSCASPGKEIQLQVLQLFDAGTAFKGLFRIHVGASGGGITVDHMRVEHRLLPAFPKSVHQHIATIGGS